MGMFHPKVFLVDLNQLQSTDTCTVLFKGCAFLSYTAAENKTPPFVAVNQQIKDSLAFTFDYTTLYLLLLTVTPLNSFI